MEDLTKKILIVCSGILFLFLAMDIQNVMPGTIPGILAFALFSLLLGYAYARDSQLGGAPKATVFIILAFMIGVSLSLLAFSFYYKLFLQGGSLLEVLLTSTLVRLVVLLFVTFGFWFFAGEEFALWQQKGKTGKKAGRKK